MTADTLSTHPVHSQAEISPEERAVRRDLAACYRLVAMYGWDDLVANHITATVPGEPGSLLINPFGMTFDEVTASNLIKIDRDGNVLSETEYSVNKTGFVIHGAVHEAREDVGCVIHLHTRNGVAMSMLEDPLEPLDQTSMLIAHTIAYHDYEGIALNMAERETLIRDLGDKDIMMLRNHGTLVVGRSVADAFVRHYLLEWACDVQLRAAATGRSFHRADPAVVAGVAAHQDPEARDRFSRNSAWPALLRKLDRQAPDYKD